MSKAMVGLVAALGSAAPLAGAHALAVSEQEAEAAVQVASVAELLETPVNASAILATLDARRTPSEDKGVQTAQIYLGFPHHHHHHYHHHHHHHHFYYHHHHHWCYYHPHAPQCY